MMSANEWAFTELDIRREEEAGPDTADMHVARRKRWQARGYSKKTADDLVVWAEEQDRRAA
ncbi:hypothetical protein [Devosia ginsengisoli]|uniref:Uncharacterized protein n=1 Tax=Devosia ginsengisoli TaxID=400770 RepID=A0A5B8LTE2_9HYPH|nr:hypothetical protein [Devosia ginsengisoli]QDZ10540.1 hypothetical protein FPZ08_07120 [Devosia ginsengisoli]